ncbi:aspartate aminotransferase family protein [Allostella vacuolata]|nr:aspartate aminotransferase family protein [Stella vacuolata]
MPDDQSRTNSEIVSRYREKTPKSEALFAQAKAIFPSGVTHDGRHLDPYGIYVDRAEGAYKWDVDGNKYIDFFGGHGALLLGHNHPVVMAAVGPALAKGTHFGANHALEVQWAQAIQALLPTAERVRFTSSGTEATLIGLRLARTYTGRTKLLRFKTHFHGWHDHMASGYANHFDGTPAVGVLEGISDAVVLVAPNDREGVSAALAGGDIAAVILEPTGSSTGMVPTAPGFLEFLREETLKHGTILIFDEVVTGFRVAPGGAQQHYGIKPDLTSLAKILAGGLPGGAIVGRKDLFDSLDYAATAASGKEKIQHPGTYNANPVSAAAGIAALDHIRTSDACAVANAMGDLVRQKINQVFAEEGVKWACYGTFSSFHTFLNPQGRDIDPLAFDPLAIGYEELKGKPKGLSHRIRVAMLVNGVDLNGWPGGNISCMHTAEDMDATAEAYRETIRMLRKEGEI